MKALLSICLFWSLLSLGCISAGEPESCLTCMGDECAKPSAQMCGAHQDACISAVIETTQLSLLAAEFSMPFRQCAPAHFCLNTYGTISTSDGGTGRMAVQCCYTDDCNNMTVSLPKREEYPPNGVQCPSCFAFDSEGCPEGKTISCTGGETKCLEARLNVSIDSLKEEIEIYFQGCTTPNVCFVPLPDEDSSPEKMKFKFSERMCTDGDMNGDVNGDVNGDENGDMNGDMNVQIGESKFSTFWAPPFLDEEKEVGEQVNRT